MNTDVLFNTPKIGYLLTAGFLYGVFIYLIPQELSGYHNREEKKIDKESDAKKEEYKEPETWEKIDPDELLHGNDKGGHNNDSNSGS